jgi:hypothetical protein
MSPALQELFEANGAKATALVAFEEVATQAGRWRLREYISKHGVSTLLTAMPHSYTKSLEYLTNTYGDNNG